MGLQPGIPDVNPFGTQAVNFPYGQSTVIVVVGEPLHTSPPPRPKTCVDHFVREVPSGISHVTRVQH